MLTRCFQALCRPRSWPWPCSPRQFAGSPRTWAHAKVALHLQPYSAKNICLPASQGGEAPDLTPCVQFRDRGADGNRLQRLPGGVRPGWPPDGVAGLSCGDPVRPRARPGVDVLQLGDLRAISSSPTPAPTGTGRRRAGGNRITFDSQLNCQLATVPGYEIRGRAGGVRGLLRLRLRHATYFSVTPNLNLLSGPELVVGDCLGAETDLSPNVAGALAFSTTGLVDGCNPCLAELRRETWSARCPPPSTSDPSRWVIPGISPSPSATPASSTLDGTVASGAAGASP